LPVFDEQAQSTGVVQCAMFARQVTGGPTVVRHDVQLVQADKESCDFSDKRWQQIELLLLVSVTITTLLPSLLICFSLLNYRLA